MRRHALAIISLIVYCLLAYSPAPAEESKQSIPNLVGTWVATGKAQTPKSMHSATKEIRITEQNGRLFRGIMSWTVSAQPKTGHYVGGKETARAAEKFIGVIAHDNKTIYLAEQGDTGVDYCRLIGPETLEDVYVESGAHPAVGHYVFRRKK